MAYRCLDCSHKGKTFDQGACPACGSFNVSKLKAGAQKQTEARKPYRLALLVALWVYLGVALARKLF